MNVGSTGPEERDALPLNGSSAILVHSAEYRILYLE
jgi:hypothetical protein